MQIQVVQSRNSTLVNSFAGRGVKEQLSDMPSKVLTVLACFHSIRGYKLTPSVYKTVEIKKGFMGSPEAVSYSGPTYIGIRSLKHSPSNANSHYEDLNTLLNLDAFKDFVRNSTGEVKPVLIISSDGGPDENPRCVLLDV